MEHQDDEDLYRKILKAKERRQTFDEDFVWAIFI